MGCRGGGVSFGWSISSLSRSFLEGEEGGRHHSAFVLLVAPSPGVAVAIVPALLPSHQHRLLQRGGSLAVFGISAVVLTGTGLFWRFLT